MVWKLGYQIMTLFRKLWVLDLIGGNRWLGVGLLTMPFSNSSLCFLIHSDMTSDCQKLPITQTLLYLPPTVDKIAFVSQNWRPSSGVVTSGLLSWQRTDIQYVLPDSYPSTANLELTKTNASGSCRPQPHCFPMIIGFMEECLTFRHAFPSTAQ